MLTGGIRTRAFMNDVLASGAVDILGLARPFAVQPDVAARLLDGAEVVPDAQAPRIGLRFATPLNAYLQLAWHASRGRTHSRRSWHPRHGARDDHRLSTRRRRPAPARRIWRSPYGTVAWRSGWMLEITWSR